jgi:Ca-activated chloride channel family protein
VSANWLGQIDGGDPRLNKTNEITDTALEFGIMTEFTSFVAVEPRVVNVGGKQRTVHVPVEMADGVSYQGVNGTDAFFISSPTTAAPMMVGKATRSSGGVGGGGFGGGGGKYRGGRPDADEAIRSKPLTAEEQAKLDFESKVSSRLRSAKGKVAVAIYLSEMSLESIKQIEALGIKVDVRDNGMKLLMAECDVAILKKLSQVKAVVRIDPLE